jgi:hypothetical protein
MPLKGPGEVPTSITIHNVDSCIRCPWEGVLSLCQYNCSAQKSCQFHSIRNGKGLKHMDPSSYGLRLHRYAHAHRKQDPFCEVAISFCKESWAMGSKGAHDSTFSTCRISEDMIAQEDQPWLAWHICPSETIVQEVSTSTLPTLNPLVSLPGRSGTFHSWWV